MTAENMKKFYGKLRDAEHYLVIAIDKNQDADFGLNMTPDQLDNVITFLLEQLNEMDQLQ